MQILNPTNKINKNQKFFTETFDFNSVLDNVNIKENIVAKDISKLVMLNLISIK